MRGDALQLQEELGAIDGLISFVDQPHELRSLLIRIRHGMRLKIGLKATRLPDGEIYVHTNSADEVRKLQELGAETTMLPSGHIEITDSTPHNIAALRNMGVEVQTLPDGRVVIRDNSQDVRSNASTRTSLVT